MIEAMLSQDGVRLPGDRRHQHRISAKRAGVWIDPHIYEKLNGFCRINPKFEKVIVDNPF